MSLVYVRTLSSGARLGLWRIDADADGCLDGCVPGEVAGRVAAMARGRRTETAAVYALLRAMTGSACHVIRHEASGKPYVVGLGHIGVSHTLGYASLIMSDDGAVAVDIEHVSDRVGRIASRFLRDDEMWAWGSAEAPDIIGLLKCWCAKETVYKLFSDDRLTFHNMRVDIDADGRLMCENLLTRQTVVLGCEITPDYVMTWSESVGDGVSKG